MSSTDLVEVSTDTFTAVVPPFANLPTLTALAILTESRDSAKFALASDAFRSLLSPEKRAEFDAANFGELVDILTAWFKASPVPGAEPATPSPESKRAAREAAYNRKDRLADYLVFAFGVLAAILVGAALLVTVVIPTVVSILNP